MSPAKKTENPKKTGRRAGVPEEAAESAVAAAETGPAESKSGDGTPEDLTEEMEAFRKYLKAKGHRITREREAIAECILRNHDHFDVDELFMSLRSKKPISKASIYRAIPLFIKSGILAEVYLEDGHMHYERVYGREVHSHLRCLNCRRIFEFSAPELTAVEKRICRAVNFRSAGHKFEIWGYCSDCHDHTEKN
ncbi:MAG: transcriptional repressor [Deltaproteobacteria bacterium]|jgi:Fur family ferric uptake transcriptional regulator|nr:transcriptional repressor [Deltaproteobacteria bacterium]